MKKIVPDTSALIDGRISTLIEEEGLEAEVVVPEFVVDELENQANKGLEIGFNGIEEISEIEEASRGEGVELSFTGRKPSMEEIELASSGRIDALIRDVAEEIGAVLYTADRVQAKVAEAKGIEVEFIEKDDDVEFLIEEFFDDDSMSVHLKEGDYPRAKKGTPGSFKLQKIGDERLEAEELDEFIQNAVEVAEMSPEGVVEMEGEGATVLQIGATRVSVTRPPFSRYREVTAVRPVVSVGFEDYDLSDALIDRLDSDAEGVLIAGSPGHGKSTFAQALAERYADQDRVVKTMENPRDLDVGDRITQYTGLDDEMELTGDFLLLTRPDFTVYDEVRKSEDFEVFSDLRMAGVGMIGVVHASEAVDAVQRLVGRVELGVIPQVCDTVVFLEEAEVAKVYSVEMTVKVPQGMVEEDLARPVVQVKEFETGKPEYEIYTYGEETVVTGVEETQDQEKNRFAASGLEQELSSRFNNPYVEFISDNHIRLVVDDDEVPEVIGQGGENIDRLEDELGLDITVESREEAGGRPQGFEVDELDSSVVLHVGNGRSGQQVDIYRGDEFLFTATVGKNGAVTLKKNSKLAQKMLDAERRGNLRVEA